MLTSLAINYYSPTLFGSLGISDVALYTGIYGLVKAVASIIFYGALIDIWGRRNPTIISSIACSVCLWIVGAYVKIGNPAATIAAGEELSPSTAAGGQAATAMIMIYSVLYVCTSLWLFITDNPLIVGPLVSTVSPGLYQQRSSPARCVT
jgi:MFS family permease